MANPVWGLLAKSQLDDETIEEAIARLITAHNADESAHLAAGQSLQSHKAAEIIDHLAGSIIEDKIGDGEVTMQKLTSTHRIIVTSFESLDGWGKGGNVISEIGSLTVYTADSIDAYAYAVAIPSAVNGLDWTKDFFWQSTIKINGTNDQIIYFGVGGSAYVGGYSGAGFKVDDDKLYCYHWDLVGGVETYVTFEITGITFTDMHVYRIIFDHTAGTLSFYIDGVLKKTWSSGLPTDNSDEQCLFEVKTKIADNCYFYAFDWLYSVPK